MSPRTVRLALCGQASRGQPIVLTTLVFFPVEEPSTQHGMTLEDVYGWDYPPNATPDGRDDSDYEQRSPFHLLKSKLTRPIPAQHDESPKDGGHAWCHVSATMSLWVSLASRVQLHM